MKFDRTHDLPDASEVELPFELVIKESSIKISQKDGMKFDRAHDLPSTSEAELLLELVIKESPTKVS